MSHIMNLGTKLRLACRWHGQVEAIWLCCPWLYWWVTYRYIMTFLCDYSGIPYHRYSRKVLWISVGTSNNNPRVIAWHYLQCVKEHKGQSTIGQQQQHYYYSNNKYSIEGTPRLLRTDCGTENSNLAFIQPYLRRLNSDCFNSMDSFRYGKSYKPGKVL